MMRRAGTLSLPRATRRRAEPVVAMINVVFLLLIFFLMTAVIAPRAPFEVTLPEADAPREDTMPPALFVSAEGYLAFGTARGEDALRAAATGAVRIEADARLPAAELARLISRLSTLGASEITLVTVPGS